MPLKLVADPTFTAKVRIPLPGGEKSEPIDFTFKHRTVKQLDSLEAELKGKTNAEVFEALVTGWSLADPFNRENVEKLLDNYGGAMRAVSTAYHAELLGVRLGN